MALRSPMGRSDSFVNARIGAPRRSGPNEGNASACAPSASDAAAPSKRAAVNAPCPPRPCHRTSIMGLPPSPLHVGHASIALTLSIWVQKGSCGNPDGRTAPSDVPQIPFRNNRPGTRESHSAKTPKKPLRNCQLLFHARPQPFSHRAQALSHIAPCALALCIAFESHVISQHAPVFHRHPDSCCARRPAHAAPPHPSPRLFPQLSALPAPPRIPTPPAPHATRPNPLAARHARLPSL